VEAILARAIERAETGRTKLSLDELVAVGAELGVPRTAIESAAAEVAQASAQTSSNAPPDATPPAGALQDGTADRLQALRARERAKWYRHLFIYLAVNAFLLFVNLKTSPDELWFVWPLAGWGLGVVLQARRVFFMSDEEAQDAASRIERKRQRRSERMDRKEARRGRRHGRIGPVDDVKLRTRIDERVDAVLAERGVRVDASQQTAAKSRIADDRRELAELEADAEEASASRGGRRSR